MSRAGQLVELKALRADVEKLRTTYASQDLLLAFVQKLELQNTALMERIEAMEAKRGPGRPKNEPAQAKV